MASMNKPTFAAIQTYSPRKPVLVFVSSRRQTRLTALDLIAFAAADMNATQFLHMTEPELEVALRGTFQSLLPDEADAYSVMHPRQRSNLGFLTGIPTTLLRIQFAARHQITSVQGHSTISLCRDPSQIVFVAS